MSDYVLRIQDGHLAFIWDDALSFLLDEGTPERKRVSHVEPHGTTEWTADMSPVGGPVLGPFSTRAEGLAAERTWLREHKGL